MLRCAAAGLVLVVFFAFGNTAFAEVPSRVVKLAEDGKALVRIITSADPIPAEQTAAAELADYLGKVTGAEFAVTGEAEHDPQRPTIYVGPTAAAKREGLDAADWGPERWAMRTAGDSLILLGGRPRGTLYAVYHFLEDVVGVRWWNPVEQYVPSRATLVVEQLDRQGEPRFRYRDIHLLYAYDGGRFAARNRINALGFRPLETKYGCGVYYGPPGGVHTFNAYVPPGQYFDEHPEWFSLIGGERKAERSQLCLTNPELRAFVVERLKKFIQQARADAERVGRPAPVDFDISQNDWAGHCQCADCQAIAEAEGSESGPLIDFLNHMADAIAEDYPEVRINTLAYQATDEVPATIRPRASIVPRLCDTDANLLRPITHADNGPFARRVAEWGAIVKDLRIWDYAVTYTPYFGLPLPTAHTYPTDYRYFAEHNVEGIFTEHEHPIRADMRDFKVWVMMKLLEDPHRDYDALVSDFTDGFYGPAGPVIRRYLADLQAAAEASGSNVDWFPALSQYRYLTLDFIRSAQATFDEAEQAVADDATLLRRVRHARLPLDRASLALWPKLMRQWIAGGGEPAAIPLDRAAIGKRCRETWIAQIELRMPEGQRAAELANVDAELNPLLARPAYVPLPEKFRDLPAKDVFDFTAEQSSNWKDRAKRVSDAEAECAITNRLELTDEDMEKYRLPMPWGAYAPAEKRSLASTSIEAEDVPGPGYHWYKLGTLRVVPSTYVYFFWSWIIQFPVDAAVDPDQPDAKFEIWSRIKFEGPGFPHGKPDEKYAISVERVVLVRAR